MLLIVSFLTITSWNSTTISVERCLLLPKDFQMEECLIGTGLNMSRW